MPKKSPKHPMRNLGELLRKKREAAGLTQMDVAEKAGLSSPQFISNIERGACGAPLKLLDLMIRLYRMEPGVIVKLLLENSKENLRRHLK